MRTFKSRQGVSFSVPDDATDEQIQVEGRRAIESWNQRNKRAATAPTSNIFALEEFMGLAPAGGPLGSRAAVAAQEQPAEGGPLDFLIGVNPMEQAATVAPAVGGARLGAAGLAKAAPALRTIGGSLGGLLGELGAQKTGLTEESPVGLAAAALPIPAAATTRAVAAKLPGAAKGISQAVGPLWEAAEGMATKAKVTIQPTNVAAAAAKLKPETFAEFATAGMKRLIKSGERVGDKFTIPFKEFRDEMTLLGRRVRSLARQGGPEYGQAKELYKAMQQDLEAAVKTAPSELRPLLQKATKLSKQAATSEKIGRAGTGITTRAVLGGGGYAYGGPAGALAAVAPDVIKAGLESPAGRRTIAAMTREGANLDQIVNALVQLGVKAGQGGGEEYTPPWEMAR